LVVNGLTASAQDAVPERSEVEDQYKWDLTAMYPSDDAWEADVERLTEMLDKAQSYRGRLAECGGLLLDAIRYSEELRLLLSNVYVFAGLKSFEDLRISKYGGMFSQARGLAAQVSEALAYFRPELLAIPVDTLWSMVETTNGLEQYRQYFDEVLRLRPYTLDAESEALLARASDPLSKFESVFSALDNADMTFGTMTDEDGNEVELTKARYGAFLSSSDRRVRRDAWIGLFKEYARFGNTLAANYEGHLKAKTFASKERGYDSALQASLYPDAIPVEVYTNLVQTMRDNVAPLQRYLRIRRQLLGVDTLHVWDLYAPFADSVWEDMSFDEAKQLVANGLEPLGDEYVALYHRGFDEKWADVMENRGKRGGAYSWGTYTSKPYFSMNFEGTLQNVVTLAHEYGHSLHSWFSRSTQPYIYSSYSLFVAEVASMTNEALLMNRLLEQAATPDEKLALLQEYLDRFRGAFYRQASFADFEHRAHEMVAAGRPLTRDAANQLYADVFEAYYGDAVHAHPLNASEWSRIPHFLRSSNYYVYQYATSFAAATALARRILNEGEPAAERFIDLLRAGGSDYPIELLKQAGVDMTTPQPVLDTIDVFESLLLELEETIEKTGVSLPDGTD
ncbi:MAG: oligoendopeptidase F, partial [Rhodothermales bacterium]|nr:oligoendopeptidase F [Rhodothermales bacterium]